MPKPLTDHPFDSIAFDGLAAMTFTNSKAEARSLLVVMIDSNYQVVAGKSLARGKYTPKVRLAGEASMSWECCRIH